jgi:hypothetical protein
VLRSPHIFDQNNQWLIYFIYQNFFLCEKITKGARASKRRFVVLRPNGKEEEERKMKGDKNEHALISRDSMFL